MSVRQTSKWLKQVSGVVLLALSLASCSGANSPANRSNAETAGKATDLAAARQNLSQSVNQTVQSATPITDTNELARRLNLPAARVSAFGMSSSESAAATAAAGNGFWCGGRGCICIGDEDCNNMFSTVCRSPSTGGECRVSGRLVVCTCRLSRA